MPWESLLIDDRLAANTYSFQTNYGYEDGKFELLSPQPEMTWNDIKDQHGAAKSVGLTVHLVVTWGYQGAVTIEDENVEKFLNAYQDVLVEVAEFAEEHKVKYLSLYEPDHMIRTQQFSVSEEETIELIDNYKEVLSKLGKVYQDNISSTFFLFRPHFVFFSPTGLPSSPRVPAGVVSIFWSG